MQTWISKPKTILISGIMTALLFMVVMFVAEPAIKGTTGNGMVSLQLAFSKAKGLKILSAWGREGTKEFRLWIVADYAYLLAYSIFLRGLLLRMRASAAIATLPLIGGSLDATENTLELLFLAFPHRFPPALFFIHSILSSLKWFLAFFVIVYIARDFLLQRQNIPGSSRI